MQVDRLDVFHGGFHVKQELVHASFKVALVWAKAHIFARIELDLGDNGVLLAFNVHLVEDELS